MYMTNIFFKLVYEKGEMSIEDVPSIWRPEVEKRIKAADRAKARAEAKAAKEAEKAVESEAEKAE